MNSTTHEPQPPATLPIVRHDGWTGEKMAIFCETLAETAVVAEACEAARMGISGAYAARRLLASRARARRTVNIVNFPRLARTRA